MIRKCNRLIKQLDSVIKQKLDSEDDQLNLAYTVDCDIANKMSTYNMDDSSSKNYYYNSTDDEDTEDDDPVLLRK